MIAYYVVRAANTIELQVKVVSFMNDEANWRVAGGVAWDGSEYLQALVNYDNQPIAKGEQ
jgi:hypothetical protein